MMQIFYNDYVTLTPFSRSFEYIVSILDSDGLTMHFLRLTEYRSPPPPP